MNFLNSAAKMLAAREVRKFRLEWAWRNGHGLFRAKTIWHGADAQNCLARFTKAMPQAINVRVLEEVRP